MRKNNVNVTEILKKVEELEKQIYSTSFAKTELANAKTAELANAKAEIETDLAKANARADAELANAELATEQIEKWKEEAYKFNKVSCQNCSESIREGFFNTQEEFEIIIKSLENFLDFALDSDIQENYDR